MSLNVSVASAVGGVGIEGTPNHALAVMKSAIRAGIPKNFVKDRARAIEGISPIVGFGDETNQTDERAHSGTTDVSGAAAGAGAAVASSGERSRLTR